MFAWYSLVSLVSCTQRRFVSLYFKFQMNFLVLTDISSPDVVYIEIVNDN